MSFAPPISQDGFHYNGDLYVEVGNLNRHKRASIAEIGALLRPDLTKSKGKSIPSKDEVGHWYTAQLIHYGLPPTQGKARAKIRLLEALTASKLLVPPEIKKLEDSLRKECQAAERKAKATNKKANTLSTEGNSQKRKQPEPPSTNVNDSSTPSLKKAKTTAKKVRLKLHQPVQHQKPNRLRGRPQAQRQQQLGQHLTKYQLAQPREQNKRRGNPQVRLHRNKQRDQHVPNPLSRKTQL